VSRKRRHTRTTRLENVCVVQVLHEGGGSDAAARDRLVALLAAGVERLLEGRPQEDGSAPADLDFPGDPSVHDDANDEAE
jgi:hypothetical protein